MRLIVNVHNVLDAVLDRIDRKWSPRITVDQFRTVLDHYRWISFDEFLDGGEGALLTFDDGYRGVLTHAAPLLRERGIPAALFVITNAIGPDRELLHFEEIEVAYRLTKQNCNLGDIKRMLRMLSEEERRERHEAILREWGVTSDDCREAARRDERFAMLSAGELAQLRDEGWTIGSHTRTHRPVSVLDECELESEIVGSRDDLRSLLGIQDMPFAYPYGGAKHLSDAAAACVENAGYTCAFTMVPGPPGSDRMALRRVDVRELITDST